MTTNNGPWFVAEGSYGFTASPEKAKKDRSGAPIIAMAVVRDMVAKTTEQELKLKSDMVWEYLFEVAEELAEYKGKPESMDQDKRRQRARLMGEHRALVRALAIYQYGSMEQEYTTAILKELREAYEEEEG